MISLGLNESSRGALPAAVAKRNWRAFLRRLNEEDGVHLIIYCVRGTQEIGAPQTNYRQLLVKANCLQSS